VTTAPTTRLTALDRVLLERAYELAARGIGSTSPNPPVGAVVANGATVAGEGYHHRAGEPHAEANALRQAGDAARGATLYVSLEPCARPGRVEACVPAIAAAGVARVVAGTFDPNPANHGLGAAFLRERGIHVCVTDDARARELIEPFAVAIASDRPYTALKMAMSLDGAITSRPGVQEWITSEEERAYVRDLRIAYDAVLVGARTVRVDDPQLTVRPPHHRLRPFVRAVACESETIAASSRILEPVDGYARTIVLAPAGARERFSNLEGVANAIFVGEREDRKLDLAAALRALRSAGTASVLCEGGPTLGAGLIATGAVDRFYWAIAPRLLSNPDAVGVLSGINLAAMDCRLTFDRVERAGADVVLSGTVRV
jgi:diaminohydroxyphosphoribosylaminopyrimidine deaminase/5-amino-6-(5-phosphoribosylamino)uracil reductase